MGKVSKSVKVVQARNRMRMKRNVDKILQETIAQTSHATESIDLNRTQQIQENVASIQVKLRHWTSVHNITQRSLNDLLRILDSIGVKGLPIDSRSLMKTDNKIEISQLAGGKHWYHGLEKSVRIIFPDLNANTVLLLNFNVDGVPLFNSSKTQFWPILASIHSKTTYFQ